MHIIACVQHRTLNFTERWDSSLKRDSKHQQLNSMLLLRHNELFTFQWWVYFGSRRTVPDCRLWRPHPVGGQSPDLYLIPAFRRSVTLKCRENSMICFLRFPKKWSCVLNFAFPVEVSLSDQSVNSFHPGQRSPYFVRKSLIGDWLAHRDVGDKSCAKYR